MLPETPSPELATHSVSDLEPSSQYFQQCRDRYTELEELLEFAAENGKLDPPELAGRIKGLKKVLIYTPFDQLNLETLWQAETEMEILYSRIAQLIEPVTIETLRTTSEKYSVPRPWWQAWLLGSSSPGRNLFRQLFWVAVPLIGLVLFRGYAEVQIHVPDNVQAWNIAYKFMKVIDPFLFGAIGAWVYLYKVLNDAYITRALHPRKISTDWLRLFMGALSGGLIVNVLFPDLVSVANMSPTIPKSSEIAKEMPTILSFSSSAVGFLTGYSVDFFYRTLDNMIRVILPKTADSGLPPTPKQQQMEILLKRLQEATSEEDKATIRRMLENL